MIGQRGVPATFGGIERHVEELGSRLAGRGHTVTVFCRTNYVEARPTSHRGMELQYLPTVPTKHAEAILHSALASIMARRLRFDVCHFHALGPGLAAPLVKTSRTAVVQTVHGRDDQRAKWGNAARSVLRVARWSSAHLPDATIVVSEDLERFYAERYGRRVWHIPNGVEPGIIRPPSTLLDQLGLEPDAYLLFVGRLVPEKAVDLLMRGFARTKGHRRLVIVGGSSFSSDYVDSLKQLAKADGRIDMLGYRYGSEIEELYSNAEAFVLPSHLEGMPLTLLEAASYGKRIVASDIPPHLEVLGSDGPGHRVFQAGSEDGLVAALNRMSNGGDLELAGAELLRERVLKNYQWDRIAEQTEAVYAEACRRRRGRRSAALLGART
jgi:glycosyltransferase involved in cell wall biosynthesis